MLFFSIFLPQKDMISTMSKCRFSLLLSTSAKQLFFDTISFSKEILLILISRCQHLQITTFLPNIVYVTKPLPWTLLYCSTSFQSPYDTGAVLLCSYGYHSMFLTIRQPTTLFFLLMLLFPVFPTFYGQLTWKIFYV